MALAAARTRAVGAIATLGRTGNPEVVSETGAPLTVATGVSMPGFNPLDLLYASVAACIVLSARAAASHARLLDRIERFAVHVTGEKAHEAPPRVARLLIRYDIAGDLDDAERRQIIADAELLCTVSNTLRDPPEFVEVEAGPAD